MVRSAEESFRTMMTDGAAGCSQRARSEIGVDFFDRPTALVARELLGMVVESRAGGGVVGGRIVETEAYLGVDDPGSHAATKGITKRNAVMYGAPGRLYVYFTYGSHHMLNLVTERTGTAGAVLLRAIEPIVGIELMRQRRRGRSLRQLANGPGKLTQALGLSLADNGASLGEGAVVLYHAHSVPDDDVVVTGRIGLSEGYDLPLRFLVGDSPFVSRGRTGPVGSGRATRRTEENE